MATNGTRQRRRVLVTGGMGFVGRKLVDALVERGDDVTSVDIAEHGHRDDVTYRRLDITDAKAVREAIRDLDVVFHNASLVHTKHNQIETVWSVNLGGTRNVIRACYEADVPKLVYVSSASVVYEGRDILDGDESLPYATSSQAPYADSKIAAEREVLKANGQGALQTCSIRPHVIFGPGDNRFLPAIVARAKQGSLKAKVGFGTRLSDFTYVDNLVQALLLAADRLGPGSPVAGQAYFVTNGEPMGFWDFVGKALDRLGFPPIRATVPYRVAYAVAAIAEGLDTMKGGTLNTEDGLSRFAIRYMCTHHYFSIEKARRDLGYEPKVSVSEGLDRTVAHLRAIGQA